MNKKEKIIKSWDLVKESWQVYFKNVLKFVEVLLYGLIGVIPMCVLAIVAIIYVTSGLVDLVPVQVNITLVVLAFVAFIASAYLAIVYSIRSKVASILLLKNNFTSPKKNFEEAKPFFVKFLGVSLLLVVLVIAWGFVFIIPAFIFLTYYGLAQYVLVAEDKRPFSAVERSYDLVRGYFWPVFGRFFLMAVIAFTAYWILSLPLSGMTEGETSFIVYNFVLNIIWAILSPYFLVYTYKVYQSLKEINK